MIKFRCPEGMERQNGSGVCPLLPYHPECVWSQNGSGELVFELIAEKFPNLQKDMEI